MMGAARIFETVVNLYQTTGYYNPEDRHLCTHRLENLKSYYHISYLGGRCFRVTGTL
jgi:hypothetical protein